MQSASTSLASISAPRPGSAHRASASAATMTTGRSEIRPSPAARRTRRRGCGGRAEPPSKRVVGIAADERRSAAERHAGCGVGGRAARRLLPARAAVDSSERRVDHRHRAAFDPQAHITSPVSCRARRPAVTEATTIRRGWRSSSEPAALQTRLTGVSPPIAVRVISGGRSRADGLGARNVVRWTSRRPSGSTIAQLGLVEAPGRGSPGAGDVLKSIEGPTEVVGARPEDLPAVLPLHPRRLHCRVRRGARSATRHPARPRHVGPRRALPLQGRSA